jgi:hypothetical protein
MVRLKRRKYLQSIRFKIAASTLIETIIAMVIVSLSFGIGVTILLNLKTSGNPVTRIEAFNMGNDLFNQSIYNVDFDNHSFIHGNVEVTKELIPYPENRRLKIFIVRINGINGTVVYKKKRIIYPAKYE